MHCSLPTHTLPCRISPFMISTVYPKKTSGRGVIQFRQDTQKEVLAYVFSKERETDLWQLADAVNPNSVQARPDCL